MHASCWRSPREACERLSGTAVIDRSIAAARPALRAHADRVRMSRTAASTGAGAGQRVRVGSGPSQALTRMTTSLRTHVSASRSHRCSAFNPAGRAGDDPFARAALRAYTLENAPEAGVVSEIESIPFFEPCDSARSGLRDGVHDALHRLRQSRESQRSEQYVEAHLRQPQPRQ